MENPVSISQSELVRRLGVCSWSLRPKSVDELIAALRQIDLPRVQIALDPLRENQAEWRDGLQRLQDAKIEILSGMIACVGEDYSTIDAIHRTGGIVPDESWPKSWQNMQQAAPLCAAARVRLVTLHAGFIPDDEYDPVFAKAVKRIAQVAGLFEEFGVKVALETGQERAETLLRFLQAVSEFGVGVNFDPANMLLYGSGDPLEALRHLMPHVKQIHLKDATRSPSRGVWGNEVTVGAGEVDWKAFFTIVEESGYAGNFVIEREAGEDRAGDIVRGKNYLLQTVASPG